MTYWYSSLLGSIFTKLRYSFCRYFISFQLILFLGNNELCIQLFSFFLLQLAIGFSILCDILINKELVDIFVIFLILFMCRRTFVPFRARIFGFSLDWSQSQAAILLCYFKRTYIRFPKAKHNEELNKYSKLLKNRLERYQQNAVNLFISLYCLAFAAVPNKQLQMSAHKSSTRISKTRILPARVEKQQFSIPLSNRYFARIKHNGSVMSTSLEKSQAKLSSSQKSSRVIDRSFSLQDSRKESIVRDKIHVTSVANNLPTIKTKHNKQKHMNPIQLNEIINSELGTLSFNMILDLREKIESNRDEYGKKSLLRIHSITSDQMSIQRDQLKTHVEAKPVQKTYEEYDRFLMSKQPVIYSRKRFSLKHKAEWVISA